MRLGYLLFLLPVLIVGFHYYMHEQAHKEIGAAYGCDNPRFGTDFVSVYYECPGHVMSDKEKELHALNEVEGYNNDATVILLSIILLILIDTKLKNEDKL